MKNHSKLIASTVILVIMIMSTTAFAVDNRGTLEGMASVKVVFDVKKNDPQNLLRSLTAIKLTRERLTRQGVQPDIVVTFRGASVAYLAEIKETPALDEYVEEVMDKEELMENISRKIIELNKAGVRMEICSLALNFAGMKDVRLQPGITKVGNSIVSLIAYQNKGYSMVVI